MPTPPTSLRELDQREHLDDPSKKQRYVNRMFDLVAPHYDDFTRLFSYGMDRRWKREIVRLLERSGALRRARTLVVDLACGTGDIGLAIAHTAPRSSTLLVDRSRNMLLHAKARMTGRHAHGRRNLLHGDLMSLSIMTGCADVVTVGYGLRNVPDTWRAVDEIHRILRLGGFFVSLDFYKPPSPLWHRLFLWYLRAAGSLYGWIYHREPQAYSYISASLERFIRADELAAGLRSRGFANVRTISYMLGGICVHFAQKTEPRLPNASA